MDLQAIVDVLDVIDMRPVLSLLEQPELQADFTEILSGLGGLINPDNAVNNLLNMDTSSPISLTDLLTTALSVDENTLRTLLALAPAIVPDAIDGVLNDVRTGVVAFFDSTLLDDLPGEGLWILTRDQEVDEDLLDELLEVTRNLGLDTEVLLRVEQEGCLYEGAPQQGGGFSPVSLSG